MLPKQSLVFAEARPQGLMISALLQVMLNTRMDDKLLFNVDVANLVTKLTLRLVYTLKLNLIFEWFWWHSVHASHLLSFTELVCHASVTHHLYDSVGRPSLTTRRKQHCCMFKVKVGQLHFSVPVLTAAFFIVFWVCMAAILATLVS